jgi:hypothetical protein
MLSPNKNILLGITFANLLLGIWFFISLCVHASSTLTSLDAGRGTGIGGRLGFAYFIFCLVQLGFWGYIFMITLKNRYDAETYLFCKFASGSYVITTWLFIFVVIGAAKQLTKSIPEELVNSTFMNSAKASIAALIISMIISIVYFVVITMWKQSLLDAQYENEPEQPANITVEPNEQQAFYQGGYQAQSSEAYGN